MRVRELLVVLGKQTEHPASTIEISNSPRALLLFSKGPRAFAPFQSRRESRWRIEQFAHPDTCARDRFLYSLAQQINSQGDLHAARAPQIYLLTAFKILEICFIF